MTKRISLFFITFCISVILVAQTSKLPLIGISGAHGANGVTQVNSTYIESVLRAGGVPIVLPINENPEVLKKMVASVDALIMTGGEDVDPLKYFNEEPVPGLEEINPKRDVFDIALINLALEQGIPILGICRGHQLLNVACGGTLYQDLPSQYDASKLVKHRQQAPSWYGTHRVELDSASVLGKILGTTTVVVNTHHHQAVKEVAPNFTVTGRSSDGVVEAMEMIGNPHVFSVQFHPEAPTSKGIDDFLPIFVYLVEIAVKK